MLNALQKEYTDVDVVRKETSSYVSQYGKIDFKHPNYWEGVIEAIKEKHKLDLNKIFTVLFIEFIKDPDPHVWEVGKSLYSLVPILLDGSGTLSYRRIKKDIP